MVTGLKSRLSYHRRLFLLLLLFSWTLVACFVLFQYGREKHFKAEQLNARLQLLNLRMLDAVDGGTSPETFVARQGNAFGDLRVTIVGLDGRVLFDNSLDTPPTTSTGPKWPKPRPAERVTPSAATPKAPTAIISTRRCSATAASSARPCPTPCR